MKLLYKITLTLLVPLSLTIGIWGWLSYRTMSKKIHADTDLILKSYSSDIIMRLLSGKELPERFNGAYNTYYIQSLTPEEAAESPAVEYGEAEAFLKSQEDFASSRIRSQIFQDNEGNFRKITVSLPTFEQDMLIEHVFWWTMLLFIVLLASVLAIGLVLLNYNMKPLYRLLDWIDRYEPGVQGSKVPSDTDIVEFRKLASAIEHAVTRFETQYEERKIFIGNASHELQTPLAVCSNRIEMMLEHPDMTEALAEEMIKVHRSLSGLIRLNKTLLLLSKIENGQFPQTADVDMNALAKESIELHQEIYDHKNIAAEIDGEDRFVHRIDEQMASVLIGNLVKNAFLYTPSGGTINVTMSKTGFSISNTGNAPLDKDKVFRRFYQPSGRKEGATGLGLALAYSVCMNNGMDITYDFINDRHIFSIILRNSK
ncbi:MAG: HAMP domain-containing histidine kinase [Bacteroidales bacterium]|nr:HAMP domain-containing histidine kinase [Bacteroidales bacterium]